ncbi:hypothetical protein GWR20_15315, partial [Mycolicibacter kumamotonensis]|nr:hypothetical protein [Mycolicibacter kumamotonensis]
YLAFGLMAALLLDATVVRMFLVPSVMKLLGDDCWWAPRWMKRLQNRIGLGEIRLPDERRKVTRRFAAATATPAPVGAAAPRPALDPTHPAPGGSVQARPRPVEQLPTRPVTGNPSGARTNRISTGPDEPPTTRFSAAEAVTERVEAPGNEAAAPDREIESWLGELRGGRDASPSRPRGWREAPDAPASPPADERTRSLPKPATNAEGVENAPTTAIPVPGSQGNATDPDNPPTEKLTAPGDDKGGKADDNPQRRGATGGVSAAELLRREGRY